MNNRELARGHTALLLVDPYNDFLSEGGKLWPRIATTRNAARLHANLRAALKGARAAGVPVVTVPHHRYAPGDLAAWRFATPYPGRQRARPGVPARRMRRRMASRLRAALRAAHDINASSYAHQLIATEHLLEQFTAIAIPTHHHNHHEEPS